MTRPDSIRILGLKNYLDKNISKHNGFRYEGFISMVEAGASITSIAKSFNVSRFTVDKWISIYREEKGRERTISKDTSKSSGRRSPTVSPSEKGVH